MCVVHHQSSPVIISRPRHLYHAMVAGLDTCVAVMRALLYQTGDAARYTPCPLLLQMVEGGLIGAKAGRVSTHVHAMNDASVSLSNSM